MKHKFLNYLTENDIRVLIFDKDGTLTDTSTLWFEPTILVLDELVNRNEMNQRMQSMTSYLTVLASQKQTS